MKHLKSKWKRIKTQNNIVTHKLLKILSNLEFIGKPVLLTKMPTIPKGILCFCLIVALKYLTRSMKIGDKTLQIRLYSWFPLFMNTSST